MLASFYGSLYLKKNKQIEIKQIMVKSKAVPMGVGKNERVSRSRERLHSVGASQPRATVKELNPPKKTAR